MEVVEDPDAFRRALERARGTGRNVGLVPTMGALHDGHRSLVRRAAAEREHVAVSIFVNPLQFDRSDDLASYPRDLGGDLAACEAEGVATVFAPSAPAMFPEGAATSVRVARLGDAFEGAWRTGHFDGVATVVTKLFSLAGSCAAYFGEKDFQQLAVVSRMATDLSLPVEIVACPTVRDAEGLALSSRNALLSEEERRAATVLWRALSAGATAIAGGEDSPDAVSVAMTSVVACEPRVVLEYAAAVDARTLEVPAAISEADELRLLIAAKVGAVRLIDNCRAPRRPSAANPTSHEAKSSVLASAPPGRHNQAGDGRDPAQTGD